jgi:RNA polymerase sigma-70 factor (ECF subfamily)
MSELPLNTETLWKEFSEHVRAYIRSKVSSDEVAEDIVQDIFVRIHQGLGGLKHEDRLQSWVFGIARRSLADYYRKKSRKRSQPTETIANDTDPEEEKEIDNLTAFEGEHSVHEEVLSWLIPMIDELPDKYRLPLKMADVEGKTQQEVADELGLSLSGAKSRVQRGREKLGEVLSACCEVQFGTEGRAVAYRKREEDDCEDC